METNISWSALLKLVLIAANIATALALYPVLKRRFPVLSLAFVAARLTESGFIAVGIVAMMALNTLQLQSGEGDPDALVAVGKLPGRRFLPGMVNAVTLQAEASASGWWRARRPS